MSEGKVESQVQNSLLTVSPRTLDMYSDQQEQVHSTKPQETPCGGIRSFCQIVSDCRGV